MLYNALLDVFLETAKEGSFSRAARNLFLTQPALTHQIKALEKSMGTRLFLRTPKGVLLTRAGQVLLEEAENIKAFCNQKEAACVHAMAEEEDRILIGVSLDDQYNVFRRINEAFRDVSPETALQFVPLEQAESYRDVTDGKVDIIIYTPPKNAEPDPRVCFTHIARLLQCVLLPPEHTLAHRPFLLVSDLRNETVVIPRYGIFAEVDTLIDELRLQEPSIHLIESDYTMTTRFQCLQDGTLLFSPMLFCETCDPLVSVPLHSSFTTSFGMLCRSEHSKAVGSYLACARDVFREFRAPEEA